MEKTPIQTTSTKCQYMLTASTATWLRRAELAAHGAGQDDRQAHRSAEDVRAVEAGERVEDRAEDAVGDPEAELAVVVQLAGQEQDAEAERDRRSTSSACRCRRGGWPRRRTAS